MTELEEQTIRLKEEAVQSHKNYSTINEEFTKTKLELEISQSQLTQAHSELDVIKGELLSQKQATESLQQEMSINQEAFDVKLKEQQSSLEEQFQLSLAKLQEETGKMENELKSKVDQVLSEKENIEVQFYICILHKSMTVFTGPAKAAACGPRNKLSTIVTRRRKSEATTGGVEQRKGNSCG